VNAATITSTASNKPTAVARRWWRIGSCNITASWRTSADSILRSTKRYA
jgi:hypothetical protein